MALKECKPEEKTKKGTPKDGKFRMIRDYAYPVRIRAFFGDGDILICRRSVVVASRASRG